MNIGNPATIQFRRGQGSHASSAVATLRRVARSGMLWGVAAFFGAASLFGGISGAGNTATERSRVVQVEDRSAVVTFAAQSDRVRALVDEAVLLWTGEATIEKAWLDLVSVNDTVGIKVHSSPGAACGTRPAVVAAVIEGLLQAGIPPAQIVIWDKQLSSLHRAGFGALARRYGVGLAGSADSGYDEALYYETALLGRLVWGDHEFGRRGDGVGRRSFVSNLLAHRITRIINVTPLLNHNLTGVSGCLFTLAFGSVDNTLRFENSPEHLATAIPEICSMPELADRVALHIVDALICQYQGEEELLLHYAAPLGQIRVSNDPVALDVLSIHELERQRKRAGLPQARLNMNIYENASLIDLGKSSLTGIDLVLGAPAR